jgi:hypothetical protein
MLSKGPPASRVIPLLNICNTTRRLPLQHLSAQAELHLAFALAAARKHVQVEEVCFDFGLDLSNCFYTTSDASTRRAHIASLCSHAQSAS